MPSALSAAGSIQKIVSAMLKPIERLTYTRCTHGSASFPPHAVLIVDDRNVGEGRHGYFFALPKGINHEMNLEEGGASIRPVCVSMTRCRSKMRFSCS